MSLGATNPVSFSFCDWGIEGSVCSGRVSGGDKSRLSFAGDLGTGGSAGLGCVLLGAVALDHFPFVGDLKMKQEVFTTVSSSANN